MIRIIIALTVVFLCSCGNAPERPDPILDENYVPTPVQGTAATTTGQTPPPATAEPAQNAAGVWHYTCTDGHPGGAGSAVPCATCGKTLVHNQTYHSNNTQPTPVSAPGTMGAAGQPNISLGDGASIAPMGGAPSAPAPAAAKAPEPAQNAAGVWHYTCSNGCAGGAGSAVACATCSSTLVHNQTYHQ